MTPHLRKLLIIRNARIPFCAWTNTLPTVFLLHAESAPTKPAGRTLIQVPCSLSQNNRITTFDYVSKEYLVKFDVYPAANGLGGNLVHFTTGTFILGCHFVVEQNNRLRHSKKLSLVKSLISFGFRQILFFGFFSVVKDYTLR